MAEQGDQGDVYRVNKLIEIEHLDWSKQLEKAVRGFQLNEPPLLYTFVPHAFPFTKSSLFMQDF